MSGLADLVCKDTGEPVSRGTYRKHDKGRQCLPCKAWYSNWNAAQYKKYGYSKKRRQARSKARVAGLRQKLGS